MRKSIAAMLVGAAGVSLTLGGCNKAASAGGDSDSIKQAIKADEAKWNQEFKAKDTEGFADYDAEDAYFVAGGTTADGSTPIRQMFANASTDPAFSVEFASDKIDVSSSGDLAYARGKFTEKFTDKKTGKVMTDSGSYLTIYKKRDDGSWKVVEDFSVPNPDTLKPVPPEKPAVRAKMTSFG